jgi:hypothetical protein
MGAVVVFKIVHEEHTRLLGDQFMAIYNFPHACIVGNFFETNFPLAEIFTVQSLLEDSWSSAC